jgi:hypothetical protein
LEAVKMAQVNAEYPDLSQMFGATSVLPAMLGMERFRQAQQTQQGNMAEQAQSMDIARQRAPVDLQHIMSQTEEARARVPFMQQQTEGLRLKNDIEGAVPRRQRIDAAIAEYAAKTSDKEIKDHENAIRKGLIDPSPEVRKQAEFMWQQLDRVKQKKLELETQERIHANDSAQRRASARDVAMIGASSRENAAFIKQKHAANILESVKAGKLDPARAAASFGALAMLEEDPVKKAQYIALSNQMEIMAQKLKPPPQPQVDPSKIPGVPLTTPELPGPTIGVTPPPAAATKLSPEDKQALEWATANPNDPRAAKIKEKLGMK